MSGRSRRKTRLSFWKPGLPPRSLPTLALSGPSPPLPLGGDLHPEPQAPGLDRAPSHAGADSGVPAGSGPSAPPPSSERRPGAPGRRDLGAEDESNSVRQRRRNRARLIQRVWLCDPELCPACGQRLEILSAITSPAQDGVIEKVPRTSGLWGSPMAQEAKGPGGRRSPTRAIPPPGGASRTSLNPGTSTACRRTRSTSSTPPVPVTAATRFDPARAVAGATRTGSFSLLAVPDRA